MAEMRIASATFHLCSMHPVRIIFSIDDGARTAGLKEAGPSASAGKLRIGTKKRIAANSAIISAFSIIVYVLAGKSPFSTPFPGHAVEFRRKNFFPFGIAHRQMCGIAVRKIRVVLLCFIHNLILLGIAAAGC